MSEHALRSRRVTTTSDSLRAMREQLKQLARVGNRAPDNELRASGES